jgi:mevalonate kinase
VPAEIVARAPGKVILFGEHAVNRGQPALSVSAGRYATCRLRPEAGPGIVFESDAPGHARAATTRDAVLALGRAVDGYREAEDYESIRALVRDDFFAPQKYILTTALGAALPEALTLAFESEIPRTGGLGSGGAVFAALATALAAFRGAAPDRARLADWAHRGDVVAHGGIASRLDTQTSLTGGAVRFAVAADLAEPVAAHAGLRLVVGDTGVRAATAEVNTRVRRWLAERPAARMRYFECIGALSRAAPALLAAGDWPALGQLMTLNQMVLEKIGVSSPELQALIEAALGAGAHGAKLAGSGGGGIMIALADAGRLGAVGAAIAAAGGRPLTPALAVPGAGLIAPRTGAVTDTPGRVRPDA